MINSFAIVGRAVADPEIKNFNSGSKVAEIRIALNGKDKDGNKTSQFFTVKIWNKQAEIAETYLKKGHRVGFTGELATEEWEQNGNKRSKVILKAHRIALLQAKDDNDNAQQTSEPAAPANDDDIFGSFSDDEIPF